MNNNTYQICTKTVMDTVGDPDIYFDSLGVSNYYYDFIETLRLRVPSPELARKELTKIITKIKNDGNSGNYDCIIGVSGGVDSTYTAYLVNKLGLKPLAVHVDNGWNSEQSIKNIENVLDKLGIDLYTEVLDWEMFRDLQLSFLKASTPDGEIPTDHAIIATLYKIASRFNIKYIISGMNTRSEGLLPLSWSRGHLDWKYIKAVQNIYGSKSLKNYPYLSLSRLVYYNIFKRIKVVSILNYIEFNKADASKIIASELNWQRFEGKHYESLYTRFYQSYILSTKFNIDKRKAHLSSLIVSTGEITRNDALQLLQEPLYDSLKANAEIDFVLNKLNITKEEFDTIMAQPVKNIYDYPNNQFIDKFLRKILRFVRKYKIFPL